MFEFKFFCENSIFWLIFLKNNFFKIFGKSDAFCNLPSMEIFDVFNRVKLVCPRTTRRVWKVFLSGTIVIKIKNLSDSSRRSRTHKFDSLDCTYINETWNFREFHVWNLLFSRLKLTQNGVWNVRWKSQNLNLKT